MPPRDIVAIEKTNNCNNDGLNDGNINGEDQKDKRDSYFLTKIIWPMTIGLTLYHIAALYILFTFPYLTHYKTVLFANIYNFGAALGVTVGIHRYFTHRSYKVKTPLKILLIIMYYMSGQHTIKIWVRDHRVHHKCSDTLGDPYNARRGSFFSHIGWVGMEKHPQYRKYEKCVNMDDVLNDPYIRFFDSHYALALLVLLYAIPMSVPMYFWNETLSYAFQMAILRHVVVLNITNTINGFAHTFGDQTYNKKAQARENLFLSIITNGEGYHNYHHTFPYDYKASDRGKFNVSTYVIDMFAKLGLAYDLQEVGTTSVKKMLEKHGTH